MAACGMRSQHRLANERGMAFAVVVLILVVLLLMGSTLIGLSMTENLAGANVADTKIAFLAAETGIQEAMYRMRLEPLFLPDEGATPCSATADPAVVGFVQGGGLTLPSPDPLNTNFWRYNPLSTPSCSWSYTGSSASGFGNYLGGTAANLDGAGRTFKFCSATDTSPYCASANYTHKSGNPLASTNLANGASYTVTVAPVVGFVGGCWQYVDPIGNPLPASSCTSAPSNPMFKVTSTGTARGASKTLSVMIQQFDIDPKPDAALTAYSDVNVQSASAVIDGRSHDENGNLTGEPGVNAITILTGESVSINKPQNLQCDGGKTGTACVGDSLYRPDSIGRLLLGSGAANDDVIKFNEYLNSIRIAPSDASTSAFSNQIVYINGNYTKPPDGSSGILIVHNDSNNAALGNLNTGTFRGIIIADKINKINGNAQIIGAIFAFGESSDGVQVDDLTGTPNIKYSKQAIGKYRPKIPHKIVRGTWHEE
jgi:hypothetical protein